MFVGILCSTRTRTSRSSWRLGARTFWRQLKRRPGGAERTTPKTIIIIIFSPRTRECSFGGGGLTVYLYITVHKWIQCRLPHPTLNFRHHRARAFFNFFFFFKYYRRRYTEHFQSTVSADDDNVETRVLAYQISINILWSGFY